MNRQREDVARGRVHYDGEATPEQIEHDLEQTRAQMSATLDAIGQKFSPGQMLDQVLASVRGGPGEYLTNLGRAVKQNPLPVSLAAIGIAWLMVSSRRQEEAQHAELEYPTGDYPIGTYPATAYPGSDYPLARQTIEDQEIGIGGEAALPYPPPAEERGEMAGAGVGNVADRAGQQVASAARGVGKAAWRISGSIGRSVSGMRQRAGALRARAGAGGDRLSRSVRSGAHEARDTLQRAYRDHPLVFGSLGMAFGAALAAGAPWTGGHKEKTAGRIAVEAQPDSAALEPREYP